MGKYTLYFSNIVLKFTTIFLKIVLPPILFVLILIRNRAATGFYFICRKEVAKSRSFTFSSLQDADLQALEGLAGQLLQRAQRWTLTEKRPTWQAAARRRQLLSSEGVLWVSVEGEASSNGRLVKNVVNAERRQRLVGVGRRRELIQRTAPSLLLYQRERRVLPRGHVGATAHTWFFFFSSEKASSWNERCKYSPQLGSLVSVYRRMLATRLRTAATHHNTREYFLRVTHEETRRESISDAIGQQRLTNRSNLLPTGRHSFSLSLSFSRTSLSPCLSLALSDTGN